MEAGLKQRQTSTKRGDTVTIDVQHPDWLKDAVTQHRLTLRLLAESKIPEPLIGWFIVTMCLRFLRCVYGSDVDAVHALTQYVMNKEAESLAFKQAIEAAPKCLECNGPVLDGECLNCGKARP